MLARAATEEMASVMRARGKDRDMDIKWGSLYTFVQNLEKNGFVESVEVTRQGARPERRRQSRLVVLDLVVVAQRAPRRAHDRLIPLFQKFGQNRKVAYWGLCGLRVGLNIDVQTTDWGTVTQRRSSKETAAAETTSASTLEVLSRLRSRRIDDPTLTGNQTAESSDKDVAELVGAAAPEQQHRADRVGGQRVRRRTHRAPRSGPRCS